MLWRNLPANAGDAVSILALGRSLEIGNVDPLQYSCLENFHGQRTLVVYGPWGGKESDMAEHTALWK